LLSTKGRGGKEDHSKLWKRVRFAMERGLFAPREGREQRVGEGEVGISQVKYQRFTSRGKLSGKEKQTASILIGGSRGRRQGPI